MPAGAPCCHGTGGCDGDGNTRHTTACRLLHGGSVALPSFWSAEEDFELTRMVVSTGAENWREKASVFPTNRSSNALRNRWKILNGRGGRMAVAPEAEEVARGAVGQTVEDRHEEHRRRLSAIVRAGGSVGPRERAAAAHVAAGEAEEGAAAARVAEEAVGRQLLEDAAAEAAARVKADEAAAAAAPAPTPAAPAPDLSEWDAEGHDFLVRARKSPSLRTRRSF